MPRSFVRQFSAGVALAALVGLAGCATGPAPYAPKTGDSDTGYTDQKLTENRYRVTFTGNSQTDRETVENYLLLRSAEVTLGAGFDYFLFDTRSTKSKTTYLSSFSGWPGWGGYGWYWHSWAWGPPYGPGPYYDLDSTSRPITRYNAYAEIVLLRDEQARKEPRSINAHEIIAHLRPPPPPPPHPGAAPDTSS